jgi:ABC-type uncharacterized transport system substrate-binding protein
MPSLRRRDFVTLLGGAAVVWPLAARAQSSPMRRVGVLMNAAATEMVPLSYVAAFVQALRQLGWTEGQNFRIDVRWNAGDAQLARIYAAQLVGLMPDVILTASTTNLTIFQQATTTIPVVFVQVSDPVEQGFVASEAKPGGNLTGFRCGPRSACRHFMSTTVAAASPAIVSKRCLSVCLKFCAPTETGVRGFT